MRAAETPATIGLAVAALLVTLGVEWTLFETSVREHILGTYPRHHDQTAYLNLAYLNFENIQRDGALDAFAQRLSTKKPQGSLLDFEGALGFILVEPNRLGALSVTFAHFALLQLVAWYVVRVITGSWTQGLLALALLAASEALFTVPGGLFDFRIDPAASCTFGIYAALVARSGFYRSMRWSIAAGVTAGYLIALRHNMIVHVGVLHAIFLLVAYFADRREDASRGSGLGRRTRSLLVSASAIALVGGPFVLLDLRETIAYYTGQFAIRAPARNDLSGRNILQHWLFYPYAILVHQVLYPLLVVGLFVAAIVGLRTRLEPWHGAAEDAEAASRWLDHYFPLAACALVPMSVLTLHSDRSPAAIGLTAAPAILTLLVVAREALTRLSQSRNAAWESSRWALAVVLVALAISLGLHARHHLEWRNVEASKRSWTSAGFEMHYDIGRLVYGLGHQYPAYMVNTVADYLEPGVSATPLFEREQKAMRPRIPSRTQQIFAVEEDRLWKLLESTNVVLLQHGGSAIDFPYTKSMRALGPRLVRELQEKFVPVGRWRIRDAAVAGWIAPRIRLVEGLNLHRLPNSDGDPLSFAIDLPATIAAKVDLLVLEMPKAAPQEDGVVASVDSLPVATSLTRDERATSLKLRFPEKLPRSGDMVRVEITVRPRPAASERGRRKHPTELPARGHFTVR